MSLCATEGIGDAANIKSFPPDAHPAVEFAIRALGTLQVMYRAPGHCDIDWMDEELPEDR